ncbi:MAG TPA: glycosyltransferase family 2 protein [Acidobacteriota bacterium]|nr:glycosyltransferase family 2 protein [Acidobacteriota bacterium]
MLNLPTSESRPPNPDPRIPTLSALRVSVVVPVRNGGDAFRQCLLALGQADPPADELIVVTDGDTQGSGDLAKSCGATVYSTSVPSGPAAARNLGASQASGDIVFFVDADVVLHPDAIGRVHTTFEQFPEIVAVFGSYDTQPGAPNFLSQYRNLLHHYVHQTACEDASTFWSGCGAIRRSVFLEVGGFDARTYQTPCIEDIALGYHLRAQGFQIRLDKQLQCRHLKEWRPWSMLKADFWYRAVPWTLLILRSNGFVNDLNVQTSSRLCVALTFLLMLSAGSGWWWPVMWAVTMVCALVLFVVNRELYLFYYHLRGFPFTFLAVFWHWLYFFYSGLAFLFGCMLHLFNLSKPSL